MSFLARSLVHFARQPSLINNITNSVRSLSITPRFSQQSHLAIHQEVQVKHLTSQEEQQKCNEIFEEVNKQLAKNEEGRMFAVVHLCGKQFKITAGDIILVEGYWPPSIGDEVRFEKVMLAGAKDFTLIGSPILDPGLVDIKATIIEKTLTHTKTHFKKKRRKQYMRINFQRSPNTMIRINSIDVTRKVNEPALQLVNENRIY